MEEGILNLKVVCTDLPGLRFEESGSVAPQVMEPVYLGIQEGEEVVHQVPGDRSQVTFFATFRVKEKSDGSPNFLGPYAQGKPDDRFFYLSWGVKDPSGEFQMFRRLKIRLGHLTWKQIRRSICTEQPIVVRLKLRDAKGGPLCGTPGEKDIRWEV